MSAVRIAESTIRRGDTFHYVIREQEFNSW